MKFLPLFLVLFTSVLSLAPAANAQKKLSNATKYLIQEQMGVACQGRGGTLKAGFFLERDFTGDGKKDLLIDHRGFRCQGDRSSSLECGMQVCSIRIYVREGRLLRLKWDALAMQPEIGDGAIPIIKVRGHGGTPGLLRWSGTAFVPVGVAPAPAAPQEPQFSNTSASVNLDATRTWILAETYLRQLGFDPGDLDGEADHDTLSAVAQFQEKFGLEITGDLPPQHLKIMQALALSSGVQSSDLGRVGVKTQSAAPPRANFSDYPATEGLVAPVAFPNFTGRDAAFRSYRTRIRNGVEGGVNFAGHYAFVVIGCGTNCRFGFVVDLRNGEVFDFPFGGEEHYQMDLQFQSDSRLVRVRWKDGWDKDTCSERDIVVTGTQFETLAARTDQAVDGLCYFSR